MLTNLEAKVKSRDHLLRELQKRDKNAAQPLRRALSLEYVHCPFSRPNYNTR